MDWIAACIIMFIGSNLYYLIVRKAQLEGIDNRLYMIATSLIPCVIFLAIGLFTHEAFMLGAKSLTILAAGSLIFNFAGSRLAYTAMQAAPNAGYSLVIQKSYAIYTSLAAIWLFGGEFSLRKFAGILIILAFAVVISVPTEKKHKKAGNRWILLSIVAMLLFGSNNLLGKYFGLLAVPSTVYLFWMMLFTAGYSVADIMLHRKEVKVQATQKTMTILSGIGLSVSVFYFFLQTAIVDAPNVGYASAINASSNAMLTILSAVIFKDHFSAIKFIGVLGVTAGILLIIL